MSELRTQLSTYIDDIADPVSPEEILAGGSHQESFWPRPSRRRSVLVAALISFVAIAALALAVASRITGDPDRDSATDLSVAVSPEWPAQADLIPCDRSSSGEGDGASSFVGLEFFFRHAEGWAEYPPGALGDPGDLETDDRGIVTSESILTGAIWRPLNGVANRPGGAVQVYTRTLELSAGESARGATVFLLVTGQSPSMPFAVSARPDGTYVVVGNCFFTNNLEFLDAYARSRGYVDISAALEYLVTDPDAAADYVDFESNYDRRAADAEDWFAQPPDERVLSSSDAPPEALAGLEQVELTFALSEEWRGIEGTVCTKLAAGWGTCFRLENENLPDNEGLVTLPTPWQPGEPLSVQLLGPDHSIRNALGELILIQPSAFDRDGEVTLEVAPEYAGLTSLDAIAQAADAGAVLTIVG